MRARGFTLTELVLILVLISIVAVVALPRLNIEGFERQTFTGELTTALRHAQKIALASQCPVAVNINSSGYQVAFTGEGGVACGSGTAVPHPTRGGNFTGSGEVNSGGSVVFDGQGRSNGLTIELANGATIIVEAETGYVHR